MRFGSLRYGCTGLTVPRHPVRQRQHVDPFLFVVTKRNIEKTCFLTPPISLCARNTERQKFEHIDVQKHLSSSGRRGVFRITRLFEGGSGDRMKGQYELLCQELDDEYGPYVPLSRIWRRLSYPSLDAARKAAARGLLPIPCVSLPGRRGTFLRSLDVAKWLSAAYRISEQLPEFRSAS